MSSSSTPSTTGHRRRTRLALVMVTVLSALVATTASAQVSESASVAVTLDVGGVGTRSLRLTNFTGTQDLTQLALVDGQPATYRAIVTDAGYLLDRDFSVVAETGNLYPVTGTSPLTVDATSAEQIPSSAVTLNLFQSLQATDVLADVLPTYVLGLDTLAGDCSTTLSALPAVDSLLDSLLTDPLGLLELQGLIDDICGAFGSLVGGSGLVDVDSVTGGVIEDLDLASVLDEALGLVDGVAGTNPFTLPSFQGLGAADPDAGGAASPTQLALMGAAVPGDLTDLIALITAQLPPIPADITTIVPADSIVQALAASTDAATAALGAELAGLTDAAALDDIVNALISLTDGTIDLSILSDLTGVYTAFPRITATPPADTAAGSYAGTHIVTLISE